MSIHASHQPEARRAIRAVSVLLMVLLLIYAVPFPESAQSIAHYLPLHMALETLAVSIAGLIFAIIWSARNEQLPRNTLLLGCAFFRCRAAGLWPHAVLSRHVRLCHCQLAAQGD